MAIDISQAVTLGLWVEEAENGGDHATTYNVGAGYSLLAILNGNDLATDFNKHVVLPVAYGFVTQSTTDADDVVVVIRGTGSLLEWVQDIQFYQTNFVSAGKTYRTEDGFTDVYNSLSASEPGKAAVPLADYVASLMQARPTIRLRITGHSLGAALATLLAFDGTCRGTFGSPTVYTFASPYVGDAQFAEAYNAQVPSTWRIAITVDVVTMAPRFEYEHVKQGYFLTPGMRVKPNSLCWHHLTTYLYLLGLQLPVPNTTLTLDADCKPGLLADVRKVGQDLEAVGGDIGKDVTAGVKAAGEDVAGVLKDA